MNLIIDQGNTRTKFAFFESGKMLLQKTAENENAIAKLKNLIKEHHPKNSILSSTIGQSKLSTELSKVLPQAIILNEHTQLPFKNLYQTPATLGKDRLAAIAGAWAIHPNSNCLVIDAGTAVTYDFINQKGEYLGGSISPGAEMRSNAMHHFTSQLPKVELNDKVANIGTDTTSSLQSGIYYGLVNEMDGFINYYKGLAPELFVFLTGGDALLFDKSIKNSIFVAQNLVLTGLNSLLDYNAH